MNRKAQLVFDLDGTLSDPLVGIHRCMNHALRWGGFDEVSQSLVSVQIGPPLEIGFRALVPNADEALILRLVAKYRERYGDLGYAENTLYEGVVDTLNALVERGIRLGVCTSKRADFAERILSLFGIRQLFDFVDGGDVGVTKLQQLKRLSEAGRVDGESSMIGDRAVDIHAAQANGMASIGVLWGYGSREELQDAGADRVIARVEELLQVLP